MKAQLRRGGVEHRRLRVQQRRNGVGGALVEVRRQPQAPAVAVQHSPQVGILSRGGGGTGGLHLGIGVGAGSQQQLGNGALAVAGGGPQGKAARTVRAFGEVGVGAGLQEQPHDVLVATLGGGRQRPLAARLGSVGRLGTASQQLFHSRLVAEGGSYRDRMLGAAVEQVARHGMVVALLPVGVVPQGQHQGPKAAAADAVVAAEAGRVDVGAGVEQQVHQIAAARFHGVVQRPPAQVVAAVGELPVGAQQPFHGGRVAGGQRGMDRVAAARGREPAAQFPAQVVGHPFMAAVDGHLQQGVVAVQRVAVGQIGARGHQQAHRVQMPLAHREVQRRHVPEARPDKGGVAFQRALEGRHVARAGRREHVPGRLAPTGQFSWLDEIGFGHCSSAPGTRRRPHAVADVVAPAPWANWTVRDLRRRPHAVADVVAPAPWANWTVRDLRRRPHAVADVVAHLTSSRDTRAAGRAHPVDTGVVESCMYPASGEHTPVVPGSQFPAQSRT